MLVTSSFPVFFIAAMLVTAGAVAAAATLPAAVLADKQDCQRQQHKNYHYNDRTCHSQLPPGQGFTQTPAVYLYSVPQRQPPMQYRTASQPPRQRLLHCQFALGGGHSGHAGVYSRVNTKKYHGGKRGKHRGKCCRIAAQQHRQGGNNALLGGKAGDQRGRNTPVAKAKRLKDRALPSCRSMPAGWYPALQHSAVYQKSAGTRSTRWLQK